MLEISDSAQSEFRLTNSYKWDKGSSNIGKIADETE